MNHQPRTLNVGESVYLGRFNGWSWQYSKATVVKMTPGGKADIQMGTAEPMRFNPDGRQPGRPYHGYEVDWMPLEERRALLEQDARAKTAAAALCAVHAYDCKATWGKERLQEEVTRLEGLLEEARRKVSAI